MVEPQTIQVRYIFLDIVGYSYKRSVEAQVDLISSLNRIVKSIADNLKIPTQDLIYLPTGDGMCIALLDISDPYDIHVQMAIGILQEIQDYNNKTEDVMRKFEVRIGINSNMDNVVIDINGHRNVAGAGINMAQRVMSMADASQILVGHTDFDILRHREKYMKYFTSYTARVKHGVELQIHQLVIPYVSGLNTNTPSKFVVITKPEKKLSEVAAYYMFHCLKNEKYFRKVGPEVQNAYTFVVLVYLHALTSLNQKQSLKSLRKPSIKYPNNLKSFEEQFKFINEIYFWVVSEFSSTIEDSKLNEYSEFFGNDSFGAIKYCIVNKTGREKLERDWPEIAKDLEVSIETAPSRE